MKPITDSPRLRQLHGLRWLARIYHRLHLEGRTTKDAQAVVARLYYEVRSSLPRVPWPF